MFTNFLSKSAPDSISSEKIAKELNPFFVLSGPYVKQEKYVFTSPEYHLVNYDWLKNDFALFWKDYLSGLAMNNIKQITNVFNCNAYAWLAKGEMFKSNALNHNKNSDNIKWPSAAGFAVVYDDFRKGLHALLVVKTRQSGWVFFEPQLSETYFIPHARNFKLIYAIF
jgi:hypothetical protein